MSNDPQPPFVEPETVPCLYVTGFSVEVPDHIVRIVAWVKTLASDGAEERRVVLRVAMAGECGRALANDLRKAFARGGH